MDKPVSSQNPDRSRKPPAARGAARQKSAKQAMPRGPKNRDPWTLKRLVLVGVGVIGLLAAGASLYFHLGQDSGTKAAGRGYALPENVQELVAAGKLGDALDLLRPMIQADPKNVPLISEGARLNLKAGRYDEASRLADKVLQLDPEHAFSLAVVGAVQFQAARFEDALKTSLRAIRLNPKLGLPYLTVGEIYLRQRKTDDAVTVLKQAARLIPDDAEVWTKLGSAYIKKQEFNKAQMACEAALQADPNYPGAHFNLAQVYFRKEDANNAMKHIQMAEDLYGAQENVNWVARARQNKMMYIKHFKLRPEGGTG